MTVKKDNVYLTGGFLVPNMKKEVKVEVPDDADVIEVPDSDNGIFSCLDIFTTIGICSNFHVYNTVISNSTILKCMFENFNWIANLII